MGGGVWTLVFVCVRVVLPIHIFSYPFKECMAPSLEQGSVSGHTIKDDELHYKHVQLSQ